MEMHVVKVDAPSRFTMTLGFVSREGDAGSNFLEIAGMISIRTTSAAISASFECSIATALNNLESTCTDKERNRHQQEAYISNRPATFLV